MTGTVNGREARIRLTIRGPAEQEQKTRAVIDTRYTGYLTLPPTVIASLGLPWRSLGRGVLADGSQPLFDVYEAEVVWDRHSRRIPVTEAACDPLVGMALLNGYELRMEVRHGGKVTIKRLA